MKQIFIYLGLLSLIVMGCERNITSYDESKITYFADLELLGDADLVITVGTSYAEPGFVATISGEDVNDKVVIDGTVDVTEPGYYPLSYSVENEDGFAKSAVRNVFVVPATLASVDVSGVYTGLRVGKTEVESGCTITKLADGFYVASDFFGGYYEFIAGYGAAYRLKTYFIVNEDNTIEALSNDSPWGPWPVKEGVYDPETGIFNFQVWNGTFHFDVILTKE